jgi:hypothetical protein
MQDFSFFGIVCWYLIVKPFWVNDDEITELRTTRVSCVWGHGQ